MFDAVLFAEQRRAELCGVDGHVGLLHVFDVAGVVAVDADLTTRVRARPNSVQSWGYGRELFGAFRSVVSSAERGASVCFVAEPSEQQPEIRDVADPNVQNREIDA